MNTSCGIAVQERVTFRTERRGRKRLVANIAGRKVAPAGRVPRISKLMALSIRINGLIAAGEIEDWAEAARLAHITRARASQIASLSLLAPEIQEELLHLPLLTSGRERLSEHHLRPITTTNDWTSQRRLWRATRK